MHQKNRLVTIPAEFLQNCVDVWSGIQVRMPKVIRWGRFIEKNDELRKQDCLQHTIALSVLGNIMITMLSKYVDLDKHLLLTAFLIHDLGEGELGRDIVLAEKNVEADDDLDEYLAVRNMFSFLPKEAFDEFHRAFLLQFCLEEHKGFPSDAREIMAELAETRKMEALAFYAIERWDYFMYAFEQFQKNNDRHILHVVIGGHGNELERINLELPGFKEQFWTDDVRQWCYNFYNCNEPCPHGGYIGQV